MIGNDEVGGGFGKAQRVAIAKPDGESWLVSQHDVRWDLQHDQMADGMHHAQVARFLRDQGVDVVVTGHIGDHMVQMLNSMKIKVFSGEGPLQEVLAAAASEAGKAE
jgi:predicted Fe-Mo cluster-binding NifX family protein